MNSTQADLQPSLFDQEIVTNGLGSLFAKRQSAEPSVLEGMGLLRNPDVRRTNPAIHLKYVNGAPPLASLQIADAMAGVAMGQLRAHYSQEELSELVKAAGKHSLQSTAVTEVVQLVSFSCPLSVLRSLSGRSNNTTKFKEAVVRLSNIEVQINAMSDTFLNSEEELRAFHAKPITNLAFLEGGIVRWSYEPIMFFVEFCEHFSFTKLALPILSSFSSSPAFLLYRNCARYRNIKAQVAFTRRLALEDWALMLVGAGAYRDSEGLIEAARFKRRVVVPACKLLCESPKVDIAVAPYYDILGYLKFGVLKKRPIHGTSTFESVDYEEWEAYVRRFGDGRLPPSPFYSENADATFSLPFESDSVTAQRSPAESGLSFTILEADSDPNQLKEEEQTAVADTSPVELVLTSGSGLQIVQNGGADKGASIYKALKDSGVYDSIALRLIQSYELVRVEKALEQSKVQALSDKVHNKAAFITSQIEKLLKGQAEWLSEADLANAQKPKVGQSLPSAVVPAPVNREVRAIETCCNVLKTQSPGSIYALLRRASTSSRAGVLLKSRSKGLVDATEAFVPNASDYASLASFMQHEENIQYLLDDSACEPIVLKIVQALGD